MIRLDVLVGSRFICTNLGVSCKQGNWSVIFEQTFCCTQWTMNLGKTRRHIAYFHLPFKTLINLTEQGLSDVRCPSNCFFVTWKTTSGGITSEVIYRIFYSYENHWRDCPGFKNTARINSQSAAGPAVLFHLIIQLNTWTTASRENSDFLKCLGLLEHVAHNIHSLHSCSLKQSSA